MEPPTTNQPPNEDPKQRGNFDKWLHKNRIFVIIVLIGGFVASITKGGAYLEHVIEEIRSWGTKFPIYIVITICTIVGFSIFYFWYRASRKRSSIYTKGVNDGYNKCKDEYIKEIETAEKRGYENGLKASSLPLEIEAVNSTIAAFKNKFISDYGFMETEFSELITVFKKHPETWVEFIYSSFPEDPKYNSKELWKRLTVVLIKNHLKVLQILRSPKELTV